jgi:Na+/H+ antiporter NhaD/arsenite permease-like protein
MMIGIPPPYLALPILCVTYILVIFDRFDRSIIALLGGGAMVLTGVLTQDEAIAGIDFNTIGLLTGMMVLVSIARRSGVFEFLAVLSVRLVRASPAGLLCALALVTAAVSALLDNVTTVLLVAPVTLSVTQRLKVPAFPFLFAEVLASNFGGTATLIGDPPNILIGSAAHLDFNDFLVHVAPVAIAAVIVQVIILHLQSGRFLFAGDAARAEALALRARDCIHDVRLLRHSASVLTIVLLGFITARFTGLDVGTIALLGGAALMLLENLAHHREAQAGNVTATYGEVDWITIFFFIGLFIVVRGVQSTGAFAWLAHQLIESTHGNLALTASVVLWASAILSAIVDNIPFVAAMIPVIQALSPELGGHDATLPLWVALSLGACFGGNGTLVGASANLTVAGIAQRAGVDFSFFTYTKAALPLTLVSVVISQLYLWLRYF